LRLDHPCAVLDGENLHVFYTAYDDGADLTRRVVGCASGPVGEARFVKSAAPVLAVEGGGQMPRVFRHRGLWHMFYQHCHRGDGTRWRHYISTDPTYWRERDARFFDPPQDLAGELMLWTDPSGRLPKEPQALLSAPESKVFKLFEYKLDIKL
jgi:hypothetical protein